jgi:hypothetical protein
MSVPAQPHPGDLAERAPLDLFPETLEQRLGGCFCCGIDFQRCGHRLQHLLLRHQDANVPTITRWGCALIMRLNHPIPRINNNVLPNRDAPDIFLCSWGSEPETA